VKAHKTYLKGKSVFIVSLIVVALTILVVYITDLHQQRSVTSNLIWSFSVIGTSLFAFMTYGLYKGVGIIDDFPKIKDFESPSILKDTGITGDTSIIEVGDGIGGILLSILLWIVMSIVVVILLIVLEAVVWFSIFILATMLYWVFFRALRFVFTKSKESKGDMATAMSYAFAFTLLYLGWIYGVVYAVRFFS